MSAPVIAPFVCLDGWRVGAAWNFQVNAAPTPDAWTATGLPAGVTISSGGLISGIPTAAGLFTVSVVASLGGAASAPLIFPMGVGVAPAVQGPTVDFSLDIPTGNLTNPYAPTTANTDPPASVTTTTPAAASGSSASSVPSVPLPLCVVKVGETKRFSVAFEKAAVAQDMPISALKLNLKSSTDGTLILSSSGVFVKAGMADSARYIFEVYFDPAVFAGPLQNGIPVIDPVSGNALQMAVQFVAELQYTLLQAPLLGGDPVADQQFSR